MASTNDGNLEWKVRVNWLYRPKDISHKTWDSRQLFVTMHSDECPLHSLRGKCQVRLKSDIDDFETYLQTSDCFWFDKFWDRYINRFFDFIPTSKIINIPERMQKLLQERYKYAIVESARGKELCEQPKSCFGCHEWCSPDDSVECADCKHHYHMTCVDPPLTRKPTRGFGWACAICSHRKEENDERETNGRSHSRSTERILNSLGVNTETTPTNEPEVKKDENDDDETERDDTKPKREHSPSPSQSPSPKSLCRYQELDLAIEQANLELTEQQKHQLRMWPFRYLGILVKLEDFLDTEDRIYPKASTRLGPKYQANVPEWHGHHVVYSIGTGSGSGSKHKKKTTKGGNNSTATIAPLDPWVETKPAGFVERGGDGTSTLMWKNKAVVSDEEAQKEDTKVKEFLAETHPHAAKLNMNWQSSNYIDLALKAYMDCDYDGTKALPIVEQSTRKSLKEPTLNDEEKKRFEDAVRVHGSELHPVYKAVRTKKPADIVRYYYLWKKTPAGREIWGKFEGRKKNKHRIADGVGLGDIAHNVDDSAFDSNKAKRLQRIFACKFCGTTDCNQWRRAPGGVLGIASTVRDGYLTNIMNQGGDSSQVVSALCYRCARLWRKYAVQWLDPVEVYHCLSTKTGSAWRQRVEAELVEDARAILAEVDKTKKRMKMSGEPLSPLLIPANGAENGASSGASASTATTPEKKPSTKRKKSSVSSESSKCADGAPKKIKIESLVHKKTPESSQEPSSRNTTPDVQKQMSRTNYTNISEDEKPLVGACRVCYGSQPDVQCRMCQLCVHRSCYGDTPELEPGLWLCDVCLNEFQAHRHARYDYQCVLCPLSDGQNDDVLKPTRASRHWAHLRCAIWISGITLSKHRTIENISAVSRANLVQKCSVCRSAETGYCITCPICKTKHVHVGCVNLQRDQFVLGFLDGQPVVMCCEHPVPAGFRILVNNRDLNEYCDKFKQTNIQSVGPRRKALLLSQLLARDQKLLSK